LSRRVRHIDRDTTRRHLGFARSIDALRAMFATGCETPLRHTHSIGDAGTLLLMPAWREGARLGIKTVAIFPGNAARGLPGLHSSYLLLDAATGVPLAQIDGDEITARRTAAASALAASYLARQDARRLLVVGSGRVASLIAPAMRAVRPIDEIVVWSRDASSARSLAARWRDEGLPAQASDDLEHSVAHTDIVSCATLAPLAQLPLIQGAWLQPGTHLDLIGSFTPQMREADAECFARSKVVVDTREALAKSGDVLQAIGAGAFAVDRLHATLAELCQGSIPGRIDAAEITLFKSVGSALEDLAAAELVFDAVLAEEEGR
jgi:ornithine cyclodeaminase